MTRAQLHVGRNRPHVVLAYVIVDAVAFGQGWERAVSLDLWAEVALVKEDIVATGLWGDKPDARLAVKPFDHPFLSGGHLGGRAPRRAVLARGE